MPHNQPNLSISLVACMPLDPRAIAYPHEEWRRRFHWREGPERSRERLTWKKNTVWGKAGLDGLQLSKLAVRYRRLLRVSLSDFLP